jgi:hypothetical protein
VALVGVSFVVLAAGRVAPIAYFGAGVLGAAIIVVEVVSTTVLQRVLPQDMLGRYFGIEGTVIYSATLVGSLVAPLLEGSLGLQGGLVVAGAVPVVAVLLLTTRLAAVDRAMPEYLDEFGPRITLLRTVSIFGGLPEAALERLARAATEERVRQGTVVVREGDPTDDFFVIASGTLEVISPGEAGGGTRVVNTLTKGDYFGEIGLLERMPRTATVKAATDCRPLSHRGPSIP